MQSNLQSSQQKADVKLDYAGPHFMIAHARLTIGVTVFIGEGVARRSHLDEHNMEIGKSIACGRALKALSIKLQKGGNCPIRHKFMA